MLLVVVMTFLLVPSMSFADSELPGEWNGKHNGWPAFEFDSTLKSCSNLSVELYVESNGNPFRTWLVYARDTKDKWSKIGSFILKENGEIHEVSLSKPMDITAVQIQLDGGYSSGTITCAFYSDSVPQPTHAPALKKNNSDPDGFNFDDFDFESLLSSNISGSFSGTHHGSGVFVLDTPLKKCTQFDLYCRIVEYTGNPFRKWIVNGKTTSGDWVKLGSFTMDKDYEDDGQTFTIKLSKAMNLSALSIELDGGAHTVTYSIRYSNAVTE